MTKNNTQVYQQNGGSYTGKFGDAGYIGTDPFRQLPSPNLGLQFPASNLIVLQPRVVNFQPTTLGNTTQIYTSPTYADMVSLASYFGDWGCSYKITEGPVHTIQVECPWDTISGEDFWISDYASEQWELIPNQNIKPLLSAGLLANPFVPASTQGNLCVLPTTYQAGVQKAYENKYSYFAAESGSTLSASYILYANQTLDYMRFGVEGVPSYTQTLKRTAVIDTRNGNRAFQTVIDINHASFRANTGTINFLMSTQGLCNNFAIPRDTVAGFMLPSYAKQVIISSNGSSYRVYAGWMVKPMSFQFITRNKVQLTQEFVWDEWLQDLYYIYSSFQDFPLVSSVGTPDVPSKY